MKLLDSKFLEGDTVKHPYEDNTDFMSKVNVFFYSKDNKAVAAYWEAPVGWFTAEITEQSEFNYVIEGEIELFDLETGDKKISAKAGDIFLVEAGDKTKWIIKKPIKTIFFIYPCPEELTLFFKSLGKHK
jgi:uncharacterized cupin superfamily protein